MDSTEMLPSSVTGTRTLASVLLDPCNRLWCVPKTIGFQNDIAVFRVHTMEFSLNWSQLNWTRNKGKPHAYAIEWWYAQVIVFTGNCTKWLSKANSLMGKIYNIIWTTWSLDKIVTEIYKTFLDTGMKLSNHYVFFVSSVSTIRLSLTGNRIQ